MVLVVAHLLGSAGVALVTAVLVCMCIVHDRSQLCVHSALTTPTTFNYC